MDLTAMLEAARSTREGVLVTIRRDDRPQLSNVLYDLGSDQVVRISTTAGRAKTANLRRTPWAALHFNHRSFWHYGVLEGTADLSPVARDPHDATVDALVDLYRRQAGEHPDWEEYRAAMVGERRLLIALHPERGYGNPA